MTETVLVYLETYTSKRASSCRRAFCFFSSHSRCTLARRAPGGAAPHHKCPHFNSFIENTRGHRWAIRGTTLMGTRDASRARGRGTSARHGLFTDCARLFHRVREPLRSVHAKGGLPNALVEPDGLLRTRSAPREPAASHTHTTPYHLFGASGARRCGSLDCAPWSHRTSSTRPLATAAAATTTCSGPREPGVAAASTARRGRSERPRRALAPRLPPPPELRGACGRAAHAHRDGVRAAACRASPRSRACPPESAGVRAGEGL